MELEPKFYITSPNIHLYNYNGINLGSRKALSSPYFDISISSGCRYARYMFRIKEYIGREKGEEKRKSITIDFNDTGQ